MVLHRPRRRPLLVLAPMVAMMLTGCISERRPKRDAAAANRAATPVKDESAGTKAPPPAPAKAEPEPETAKAPTPPPTAEPEHKPGEASRKPNYAVPAGEGPSKGPDDALVTIVEWNAFDCDECRKVPAILDRVLQKWGNDVRLVFRHAPVDQEKSKELAKAAVAAAAAGKFWEVHDELMTRGNLTPNDVAKLVTDRGGDVAKFASTLASEATTSHVDNDVAVLDVFRGEAPPPILFVNGRYLDGSITFEQIDALVAEEKAKAEAFIKATGAARNASLYEEMRKRGGPDGSAWRGLAQIGERQ